MEALWIVDRIVGETAVCEGEGRVMRDFPLSQLPPGVGEGDCLRIDGDTCRIDLEETARRREKNRALLEKLKGRGGKPRPE